VNSTSARQSAGSGGSASIASITDRSAMGASPSAGGASSTLPSQTRPVVSRFPSGTRTSVPGASACSLS